MQENANNAPDVAKEQPPAQIQQAQNDQGDNVEAAVAPAQSRGNSFISLVYAYVSLHFMAVKIFQPVWLY